MNRSEKNGLCLEVSDGATAYEEFVRIYQIMWERKQFNTSVDVREFAHIQEQLPAQQKMQIFIARAENEAVGAVVCSQIGDTIIYLLGATNEKARELKAAYFLHWQVMCHYKQRGGLRYDLGGIDPDENPGGFHFKSGFGGVDVLQLPTHARAGGLLSRGIVEIANWRRRSRKSIPDSKVGGG